MREIKNMSVLITGGGSGIGEAAARYYAEHGARVTICGRREDKIRAVAESIGDGCAWVCADVQNQADRARLVSTAASHGGGIDALISNAGNMLRRSIGDWNQDDLLDIFNTNVVAGMMLSQEALPHLVQRKGCIIFIGSVYTQRAFPGAAPYAATKGALEALVKVLASEVGPRGVRVGAVRPGAVLTEINQRSGDFTNEEAAARLESMANQHVLGRTGTSREIAEGIAYLTCAEWVTGDVLSIDGGLGLGVTI
jgi:3-oxoacyl-[acyl-carrier protein] reductase